MTTIPDDPDHPRDPERPDGSHRAAEASPRTENGKRAGHLDDRDWDAQFDEIISHLDLPHPPGLPAARHVVVDPAPVSESLRQSSTMPVPAEGDTVETLPPHKSLPRPEVFTQAPTHIVLAQGRRRGAALEYDLNDDFVPPEPAPIDTDDPSLVIMLLALIIGPVWLLYLLFADRYANLVWWFAAVAITLTGFALAVARQPKSRDEDDPEDDGARV